MTNNMYTKEPAFVDACGKAGIPATARQASKFRRGYGAAYNAMKGWRPETRLDQKGRSEAMNCQRAQGVYKPCLYGPYAPKGMCNSQPPAPKF